MSYQNIFKRYEIKYLVTKEQRNIIESHMNNYMEGDKYGRSNICNIYFDTPDYLLIRRSIDKPVYKEKLRLRSYGTATAKSNVFIELKKKYKSVVYKRRMNTTEEQAMKFLCEREQIFDTQIAREVEYCFERYNNLQPKVFLSYEREAFYCKTDKNLRITFDENILWRDYNLSLCSGIYGTPILEEDQSLMEIKTAGAMPMWLTAILSQNKVYKTSFSKYGRAYESILHNNRHSENLHTKYTQSHLIDFAG